MKCNEREKLFWFAHQMLEPDEVDQLRRHLAGCAECRQAAEEYQQLNSVLDDWNTAEPSPWFDAKVRARVAASARQGYRFFGFGRLRILIAGVAVIVLIVGGLVVFSHHQVVENNQPVFSQQQTATTTVAPGTPETTEAQRQPLPPAEQLKMDENLSLLEDYDVVSNFDALSELPQANDN